MADDAQYETHKRKYEENTSPSPARPSRRATGFSAPIVPNISDAIPAATVYGSVPPPMDEFEMAKQKLKELASRALNAEAKRSKADNGGGFTSGADPYMASNIQSGNNLPIPVSHSYSGNKKIEIPNGRVGVIIGKAGETIKYLQVQSGAKIQITRDADHDPNLPSRTVEIMGSADQIAKAEQLINEVLSEATVGVSGAVSRRVPGAGSEQFAMRVPNNKVGLVIGKGGETIKNIQATSGARVQVIPLHPPPGDTSGERTVQIEGSSEQIEIAKQMVNEVIENRLRNSGMSGGYSQQQQTSWAPQPAQVQQPGGYGYSQQQPGAYPVSQSQYGMSQPPYSGYPQQQQTAGGYPQNWDQSNGQQSQQGTAGYDYYGQQVTPQQQQPASGAQTDNSGYNYGQPPTSGGQYGQQGYTQDGYGGAYQAQAQTQPPAQQGYDQQQGYGSTTYTAQGEANPNPNPNPNHNPNPAYPTQGSNQGGYGMPPTSQAVYPGYAPPQGQRTPTNPPAYGQSPSQVGGYTQTAPVQAGYPPAAGPTYGAYPSAYGAPPVTPPSYGQQPQAYYGGAYSQPPAYPTPEGATPPAAAATQPSAATKASPQS